MGRPAWRYYKYSSRFTQQSADANIVLDAGRLLTSEFDLGDFEETISNLIVFLPCSFDEEHRSGLEQLSSQLGHHSQCHVVLVGSYRSHFGDHERLAMERTATQLFQAVASRRLTILRTGHLLGTEGTLAKRLRSYSFLHPLVTKRWKSCFLHVNELFATIDDLTRKRPKASHRIITVLGPNRLLREVLPGTSFQRRSF